ncbi:MAG TPA: bifunctional acetate--CoA ligase family protein/GNAT family N-acetyltransferase, partial [Verrucomicrobiae bacterium]|nr:bifunctional acetate--CoA ligase family protein/GNAT family N-acetyltransferase [Verrucomicrobiae bacterium]
VSVGSMLDVGWGDLLHYCAEDPRTKSILCYMESVGDARSFLSAAREASAAKPVIVLKVGRTGAAARAVVSHTGSLTGSDAVIEAAFRRAGVLRVDTIGELFGMAELLAKQPRPAGPRLAVVTNGGGPGALATDTLIASGGQIASLAGETREALNGFLPSHWSHGNPVDILGDADATRYARAVEIVGRDAGVDGVLAILTPQAMTDAPGTARALQPFARHEKPLLASWMGGASLEPARTILNAAGIPSYEYPDSAARAFALMWRYGDNLRQIYETPVLAAEKNAPVDQSSARAVIDRARLAGRTLLTEIESKRLLAAYGIPVVEPQVACDEEEAVRLARKTGFPVAVKLHSETVTHKSDVGGVQLDIRTVAGVRQAWRRIEKSVREAVGAQHFLGVSVQRMISREGLELILGSSVDPQFGPVLLFGAGGELVEVIKDQAIGLPPLNSALARKLMEQTRIFRALEGVRGRKPVDLDQLALLVTRVSQLILDHPRIAELDINPLLAGPEEFIALDARVALHPEAIPDGNLPRPAIRPYPLQYVWDIILRDGVPVTLRPIRAEDEPAMVRFHQSLSERSVYLRYFSPLPLSERADHERLSRLCFTDYDREIALVAEHDDAAHGREIRGVGRLIRLHGLNEAEFALVVSDAWQRRGLGAELLRRLVQIGRAEGLERITANILPDNREMRKVACKAGFSVTPLPGAGECLAEIRL